MANYDSIDLRWTWDGDYSCGDDGDLEDTSFDYIYSLIQEIQTIVKGEFKDWEKHPNLCADLNDYNGEPNTRATGDKIANRIKSKLVSGGLVRIEDLRVKVVPVHLHQVLVSISVQASPSPNNSLQLGQPVVVNTIYDSSEHSIYFLPENIPARDNA